MPLCLRDVICAEKSIKGLSEKLCVSGLFDITKVLRHGALMNGEARHIEKAARRNGLGAQDGAGELRRRECVHTYFRSCDDRIYCKGKLHTKLC